MSLTLTLSDEILRQAGMSADEARIEIACRFFDAEKLHLWAAAQLAQLSRVEFEAELKKRKISIYRPTLDDLKADLATLEQFESLDRTEK